MNESLLLVTTDVFAKLLLMYLMYYEKFHQENLDSLSKKLKANIVTCE